ncbi:MAG: DUF3108 domain-containing protein [Bacteroidota bacterium]|nr:DUF3108 domain-containing protein [Bacteroidota bacterium]
MKGLKPAILFLTIISAYSTFSQDHKPAYNSDEKLKYLMYYGWFDGGYANLDITNDTLNSEDVYHVRMHAKTIGLTDKLYHVSDIYESYFNPQTGLPIKAIRNISEGKYRYYNEVKFNQKENFVQSEKSGKIEVPENCFDILSSLYHLRNVLSNTDLKQDTVIKLDSYFSDEVFPLLLRYHGKERIETKLGEIDCIKFLPVVEVGRVFETEDDMEIWFSDDKNRLPVRVKFHLFVGALKCDLIEYSGLMYDFVIDD